MIIRVIDLFVIGILLINRQLRFASGLSSCPSDAERPAHAGMRWRGNQCVTVATRADMLKLVNVSKLIHDAQAAAYCSEHFKNGRLLYYQPRLFDVKEIKHIDLDGVELLGNQTLNSWNSFLCIHQPYDDCSMDASVQCVFDPLRSGCHWQVTFYNWSDAELPYGKSCNQLVNLTRRPCICDKCSDTAWTSWKNHTDKNGRHFRIRYRPFHWEKCHDCLLDSQRCCHEVDSNETDQIACFNASVRAVDTDGYCTCPSNATGLFCEEAIPLAKTLIHTGSLFYNLLHKIFMFALIISVLLFLICVPIQLVLMEKCGKPCARCKSLKHLNQHHVKAIARPEEVKNISINAMREMCKSKMNRKHGSKLRSQDLENSSEIVLNIREASSMNKKGDVQTYTSLRLKKSPRKLKRSSVNAHKTKNEYIVLTNKGSKVESPKRNRKGRKRNNSIN